MPCNSPYIGCYISTIHRFIDTYMTKMENVHTSYNRGVGGVAQCIFYETGQHFLERNHLALGRSCSYFCSYKIEYFFKENEGKSYHAIFMSMFDYSHEICLAKPLKYFFKKVIRHVVILEYTCERCNFTCRIVECYEKLLLTRNF